MKVGRFTNMFIILSIVAVLVLSSGCVPVAKVYVCSDGREVSDLSQCEQAKTPVEVPAQPTQPNVPSSGKSDGPEVVAQESVVKVLGEGAKPLFEKTATINNMKFNYFRSDDPYTQNRYYVSKDKVKIELNLKNKFVPGDTYDTVYLDLKTKTAVAYCERQAKEVCNPPDEIFNVEFEDYRIATPFTWVENAETAEATGKSKKVDGRQVKEVQFTFNGKQGYMWMDSFFGAPVEVQFDGITYRFDNMLINDAKDADFMHKASTQ